MPFDNGLDEADISRGNGKTLVLKAFAPMRRCETNGVSKC